LYLKFFLAVVVISTRTVHHLEWYFTWHEVSLSLYYLYKNNLINSKNYLINITSCHYISQLVCTLWLVSLAGHALLYGPLNSKVCATCSCHAKYLFEPRDIINILLTSFSRSVLYVTDPHFFCSNLWPERFALGV